MYKRKKNEITADIYKSTTAKSYKKKTRKESKVFYTNDSDLVPVWDRFIYSLAGNHVSERRKKS